MLMLAHQTTLALTASATDELTGTYVRKLERQRYRALALLLVLVIASFIWLLLQSAHTSDQPDSGLFSNAMYLLTALIGSYWTFCTAYRARRGPLALEKLHYLAWLLLGLGLLTHASGNLYYGYYQLFFHSTPAALSYADLAFTFSHGLILAGLLLLPVQAKNTRPGMHMVIDALITTLCLFGVNWSLVIDPMLIISQPGAFFSIIMSISHPCWDILLILAFALFIHQRAASVFRPSLLIYGLAVLAQFWADTAHAELTSYSQYHPGMAAIEPFWFLSMLLFGFASLSQYNALVDRVYTHKDQLTRTTQRVAALPRRNLPFESRFVLLQSFMIYIPFTLLLILTLISQFNSNSVLTHSLDILCAIVLFLLITHYVLATYENARLVHEKEQSRTEAELLRRSTASLSSVLEMDLLLSHIVTIGATELGFEAAALVLNEEYDRALDEQSCLLARAATSTKNSLVSWRIASPKIPYCLAMMGQRIEVLWAEPPDHTLTSVHQWHIDQHMQSSLFVPLTYQGKIQGSLIFSLRTARRFTPREYYLANAFAMEAANAIEHARLYELARENALFAQAMSNVAARLNSVVATGMGMGSEIHHLICSEGAHALRADLAILYVHHPDGQFVPQAAVTIDPEPPTFPQEWPPIAIIDYSDLLVYSIQPTLFHLNQPFPTGQQIDPGGAPASNRPLSLEKHTVIQHSPALTQKHPPHAAANALHALRTLPARAPLASPQARPQQLSPLQETLRRRYVTTVLLAPLIIHQTPMGLLVLARTHRPGKDKRDFALADLVPAQDFAGQAAIAFTNARLYEQLHTAHRRMQELDQLKDQFMVTASHELRTPLTAVQGYLELLEHYHTSLPPEQQQEFLEKASRGCEELVLLLNNVMDASRLEIEAGIHATHLERLSLREVVDNVVDLILLQAKQEHRDIQVTVPSQLMVRADPTRLRQVIRNLSANALKYSPPGMPLSFSARPVFSQNASVILSVTDRGKGIQPHDQPRLFQRFVRLESDLSSTVRGSGLGLYISRRLIEAMNGKIWVESTGEPGAGSTFCVQLPMA
jgi:signal transduction histidine kinase